MCMRVCVVRAMCVRMCRNTCISTCVCMYITRECEKVRVGEGERESTFITYETRVSDEKLSSLEVIHLRLLGESDRNTKWTFLSGSF